LLFFHHFPIISENGMVMRKVVAIVGMAGSGKSEVAKIFEEKGYSRIRFGDITDIEIKKRTLEINEANERHFRELLRKELGMAAYAILNQPIIDEALKKTSVVADGLYSWEEYLCFKGYYLNNFFLVSVYSSPKTRYFRLAERILRPLKIDEAVSRDKSEIENLNKGGPIAMADYTILNESDLESLRDQTEAVLNCLNNIT
jgi:dephospho-CoA kinase